MITIITDNRTTPYLCTIAIGNMKYGHKMSTTKKKAKQSAAEETLDLFLPGAFEKEQQSTLEEEFQACTCTFSVTAQTIIIYVCLKAERS